MLTLTENATLMISTLLRQADLPEGAGLRIAQRSDHPALAMSLTSRASARDVVLREGEMAVFLSPAAAKRLTCRTLDARTNEIGAAFFLRD